MSRIALAIALLLASGAASCGGITAPDLFIVQRSGAGTNARLTLLVNEEGGVTCNGVAVRAGHKLKLSDAALIEAREIQEDLHDLDSRHFVLPPRPESVLSYVVRAEDVAVRFSDNSSGQPKVLHELTLFVLQTAQGVCGLPE